MEDRMTRAHLFCLAENKAAADAVLTGIFGGDQSGSFGVPVGEARFGCSGLFDEEQLAEIQSSSVIESVLQGNFEEAAAKL
jgi:hypothetical protein